MYTVALLVAMTAAEGSVGHKGHPHKGGYHDDAWPGYHNTGGWGLPYGGYNWPGYACWGGCGGYVSPAYGVPMTPLINPRPRLPDEDEDRGDDNGKKKPKKEDEDEGMKKGKPKKPKKDDEDETNKISARLTILVPAGAKLRVDGRAIEIVNAKTFTTPALEKGYTYYYEVRAEVIRDGKPIVETRQVTLKAGASIRADFRDMARESVAAK